MGDWLFSFNFNLGWTGWTGWTGTEKSGTSCVQPNIPTLDRLDRRDDPLSPGSLASGGTVNRLIRRDDVRLRSPTSGATSYTFSKIIMRDDLETITLTSAISQRLVLCIRLIKPKRQRTVTPFQTSPSADKSLLVFNPLGIERTETD
jgi:hypothetical protein